ncbi:MAG: hypothetical protein ACLT4X_03665 [Phascolarctobacterium sp.]
MSEKKFVKNGKKLGVLGGLGPAAAAEFLRQMAAKCPASTDQEHPVIYMISDCEIPDRGTAIFGNGPSPRRKSKKIYSNFAIWVPMFWRFLAILHIILSTNLPMNCPCL